MPIIIAISAWKRSGKDTAANHLVTKYGFKRIGFADELKNNVSKEFSIERSWIENPDFKESALVQYPVNPRDTFTRMIAEFMFKEFRDENNNRPDGFAYENGFKGIFKLSDGTWETRTLYFTPRAACILEGSTKRVINPDHWVNAAFRNADTNGRYVISDARYRNEMDALNTIAPKSVTTVRIDRFTSVESNDPSEHDLDEYKFDYRINNKVSENKTLEEFKAEIDIIMSKLGIFSDQKPQ